jgi:hypothetical protein
VPVADRRIDECQLPIDELANGHSNQRSPMRSIASRQSVDLQSPVVNPSIFNGQSAVGN